MESVLLVIDVGLTNCKTAVFSPEGILLDVQAVATRTLRSAGHRVEQSPDNWWQAMITGIRAIRERHPEWMDALAAISVTGHMHALVCLNPSGRALGAAMVLGDLRSARQARSVIDGIGLETLYRRTGARMDASMPLAKICWIREHEPERFSATDCFTGCKDYLRMRMTHDRLTDPMDATATAMYDIRKGCWCPALCEAAGIPVTRLPSVVAPWALAGQLQSAPARELGLPPGVPVVVGAGDDVEALGYGLDAPGTALEHLGTTGSILACNADPCLDQAMSIEVYPHLIPGLWLSGGAINAAGAARDWARGLLRDDGAVNAPKAPNLDAPLIFVPHLAGARSPEWDANARGCWAGLSLSHDPQALLQAVQEGVWFTLRSIADAMDIRGGNPVNCIRISRKPGEDPVWLKQRASAYNRVLEIVDCPEPTAQGAALLAAVALGWYPDLPSAIRTACRLGECITPDPGLESAYTSLYRHYLTMERAMREWSS